jgi:hypothetical protein
MDNRQVQGIVATLNGEHVISNTSVNGSRTIETHIHVQSHRSQAYS